MTKVLPGHFSTYQVSQGFGHAFPFGEAAQENVSLETPFHRFGLLDRGSQRAVLRCLVSFGCSTGG